MSEQKNAKIRSTDLGFHDGFGSIPNAWLHLEYDHAGQGFGGYALGGAFTHEFIYGILNALEVERWEKLPGTPIRVQVEDGLVRRIGHFIKDQWFDPKAVALRCERAP